MSLSDSRPNPSATCAPLRVRQLLRRYPLLRTCLLIAAMRSDTQRRIG